MGNLPASLQEERRLKTCLNGKSTRVSAREPHPGLGNQPATQRAPQAEDPWFWKSACVTQGFRQAEDPSLTNATTSYTVSVRRQLPHPININLLLTRWKFIYEPPQDVRKWVCSRVLSVGTLGSSTLPRGSRKQAHAHI